MITLDEEITIERVLCRENKNSKPWCVLNKWYPIYRLIEKKLRAALRETMREEDEKEFRKIQVRNRKYKIRRSGK